MNEELVLAVDEHRLRPPGRTWLIPVRLDDGPLPQMSLGAGQMLDDLNYVDLFGPGYTLEATSLVTTIHERMGESRPNAEALTSTVDKAPLDGRRDLLKRLTKEMLLDPTRRIELDDLGRVSL